MIFMDHYIGKKSEQKIETVRIYENINEMGKGMRLIFCKMIQSKLRVKSVGNHIFCIQE